MKNLIMTLLAVASLSAEAQTWYDKTKLILGPDKPRTVVTIQKDLKTMAQDEEIPAINVLYVSPDEDQECRIESKSSELKAGERYYIDRIGHHNSVPRLSIDLISVKGDGKEASIECKSKHEDEDGEESLSDFNTLLGEAILMENPGL